MQEVIIFFTTFVAAILSSMSGGGTSIIVIPVLLALGMSYPLAMTTVIVCSAFWTLPASRNYLKGKTVNWTFIVIFSLIGLIGCYLGVLLVTNINERILEICAGILILLLVSYTYFRRDLGLKESKTYSKTRQILTYPLAIAFGFYETVFGAGNAVIFTILTFYTRGFDFVSALGSYYAISFSWEIFSATLLIRRGYYDLWIMPFAVVGALLGAYIGSRYAKHKGNRFIKVIFVVIGGILGLKLLLGW